MDEDAVDWNMWWERLKVDIPEIDAQHRWLIQTIRTFDADAPVMRRKEVLLELMRYTRQHFSTEEALMALYGYPGEAQHRKSHDRMLDELTSFTDRSLSDSATMQEFHSFVKSWLIEHILGMDVAMARYIRDGKM